MEVVGIRRIIERDEFEDGLWQIMYEAQTIL